MLKNLKTHWPVVLLLLISIILCVLNYTPKTFLSGWDTLHVEFNFPLAFQRYLIGVFRPEQGLGAVAGHSDMADLPRLLILYISHFILPLSFLRYFYVFLNIITGSLGMYFFLNKFLLKQKTAGFLGALFYLLNLGTVQTFNVPFEMFTTIFATIPLIFYFASAYLLNKENRTKNLIFFAIISLLNAPSAYAATLWYIFFACFLIYFFTLCVVIFKKDKQSFKNFTVLCFVFVTVNLFWLMPNIYFIINHGKEVANANINLLFSDQAFLKNKEFGNIKDLLQLKIFYFDWNIYAGNNTFTDLLTPYINHLKTPLVLYISYFFGLSSIFGGFYAFKKLRLKFLPFIFVLLFSFIFLINDNFPISPVYNFFQNHIPFFKEALRFPEDKIINVYVFIISIFFGYACLFVIENIKRIPRFKIKIEILFTVAAAFMIIYYSLPSFFGNFINYYMKVQIPNYYFQTFDYLNTQPSDMRVANLPIESPWGWVYYDWQNNKPSYQGAGFLYFGIKQPLLDRDFDRWSPYNESYYREMSYAIYKGDPGLLKNVIAKYKIGFILIDKSVTDPQNPKSIMYFNQAKNLIEQTGLAAEEKNFGSIELFKLNNNTKTVDSINSNVNVSPITNTTYEDFAMQTYNNYISDSYSANFNNVVFPFRDLIDNQSKLHNNIITIDSGKITLNPLVKVNNFESENLLQNLNLLPAEIIVKKSANKLAISLYPNAPVLDNTPLASPIKTSIILNNNTKNLEMSFNNNSLFDLGILPDNTPVAIGKTILQSGTNKISIFDRASAKPIGNVLKVINPFFSSCGNNPVSPKIVFLGGKIQVSGKGNICILIPYSYLGANSLPDKEVLTDFQFTLNGNAVPSSCLFDIKTLNCLYYGNTVKNGNTASFTYVIPSGSQNESAIELILENSENKVNTYTLSNLSSWYSESLADLTLPQGLISNIFADTNRLSFKKMYLSRSTSYNLDLNNSQNNVSRNTCASKLTDAKKENVIINNKSAIKYTSETGSYCDHFSYPNLPHAQGYLITVESKNLSGLPLNICVSNNTSGKCDIYSNLSSFSNLNTNVFLLPPMDTGGLGYTINLENPGIKASPSINYLSSISIIPIPYNFLENIKSPYSNLPNQYRGSITKVIEYNPLLYLAETSQNPTIVTLNQSFEKGFKAYYLNCTNTISCFIEANFAPFFGKELKDHVLVNNWANGWITDNSSALKIAIIFLPQYFEYLGFILIAAVFIFLGLHLKQNS